MAAKTKPKTVNASDGQGPRPPAKTKSTTKPAARDRDDRPRGSVWRAAGAVPTRVHGWLGDQAPDVYGILLVAASAVSAFGLFSTMAGPVGVALQAVLRGLFGVYAAAVPVLLLWWGVQLLRDRPTIRSGRELGGLALIAASAAGTWHILAGEPAPADGVDGLYEAAGLTGLAVGGPASALLADAAVFVLPLGVAVGLVLFTGLTLRQILAPSARLSRPVTARLAHGGRVVRAKVRARRQARKAARTPAAPTAAPTAEPTPAPAPTPPSSPPQPEPAATTKPAAAAPSTSAPPQIVDGEELPPVELFATGTFDPTARDDGTDAQKAAIDRVFAELGVPARVQGAVTGPSVTRFEVALDPGTRVQQVTRLADDLAYALGSKEVRLLAPIPGKSAIGVEVPRVSRALVTLGDLLRDPVFAEDADRLRLPVGVDVDGQTVATRLEALPHLLIAGATGAGKSKVLQSMLAALLVRSGPAHLRLLLIDPKRVELAAFADMPHLLAPPVTDPGKAASSLEWVAQEMERRYDQLAQLGVRDLPSYERARLEGTLPDPAGATETTEPLVERAEDGTPSWAPMPHIVVAVDELADLMMTAKNDVEQTVTRVAQKARAVGITLLLATQRPSVEVVTGLIKANVPSRLALAASSQVDSRTILDEVGAERLTGRGDLLFHPAGGAVPQRAQGCWVDDGELRALRDWWVERANQEFAFDPQELADPGEVRPEQAVVGLADEPLLQAAAEAVVEAGLGSTSMLQRRLRIGFGRAARIMDQLEEVGVVGASRPGKPREVRLSREELDGWLGRTGSAA